MTNAGEGALYPLRFPALWLGIGWLLVGAVVFISLAPLDADTDLGVSDHTGHVIAYLVLMTWFGGAYRRRRHLRVAGLLILLGLTMETLQGLMGFRAVEAKDIVANLLGVALGFAVLRWLAAGWCARLEARLA